MTKVFIDVSKLSATDASYLLETVEELVATAEMILTGDIEDLEVEEYLKDVKSKLNEINSSITV